MRTTPQLFSEKIFMGEMSWDDLSESRRKSLSAGDTESLMQELSRSNDEILAAYSPESVAHLVTQRVNRKGRDRKTISAQKVLSRTVPYVLACAACAVFVFTFAYTGRNQGALPQDRIKGIGTLEAQPRIFVYKKIDNEAVRLFDNAQVRENDILQVSYIAAGSDYGAIISVDGNGVVTQHFPYHGNSCAELVKDGEVALDFAYQLDDAPDFERFFFITGSKPVSFDALRTAFSRNGEADYARKLNPADFLPRNTTITEFTLIKGDK
ncbi:MAG: hypothetical protein LBU99_01700 [Spirochaetaceae bacterium]|jgi:hypothetical protein|nr:hypothetical protein [Spirochaetaceae bacterium]